MGLLDDLWAQGDREGVFQRVLPLMWEAPVLFGGPEGLRRPFLAEAVRAWDAGLLVPRGKAARPLEAAILGGLWDLYAGWIATVPVQPPAAEDAKLTVADIFGGLDPVDTALLKLVQTGSAFLTPADVGSLCRAADEPASRVLAGLARAEESRRAAAPDRAKALDKFALGRRAGQPAEALVAWAAAAREGVSVSPAAVDEMCGWGPGTSSKRLAGARKAALTRLTGGKAVEEPGQQPSFETLSRYFDEDLPEAESAKVAAATEEDITATKALGRIARLAAFVADATLAGWEPADKPGAGSPSTADFAGWAAGGRADVDDVIVSDAACLARATALCRALVSKQSRTLGPVPADAVPARRISQAPAVAPVAKGPTIVLRGYPGRIDIVRTPDGVKVDEDGHVKAFSWKAGSRDVLADISPSGSGIGVRLKIRAGGAPAGDVPVTVADTKSLRPYSSKPTDSGGEVVVRGIPIHSFRVDVAGTPVDVEFESF